MLQLFDTLGDIDALVVAPKDVSRDEFFDSFYDILKAHDEVKELVKNDAAYVPTINMKFKGIEFDLLFTR